MIEVNAPTNRPIVLRVNGQLVTVKVLEVRGEQVRLGVEAPKGMSVHREEVRQRGLEVYGYDADG